METELCHLSWFELSGAGRLAYEILILPQLLYLFWMLPITLKPSYLASLTSLFEAYVWQKKQPICSYTQLVKRRKAGGIAMVDIKDYNIAIHLDQLKHWFTTPCNNKHKNWWLFPLIPHDNRQYLIIRKTLHHKALEKGRWHLIHPKPLPWCYTIHMKKCLPLDQIPSLLLRNLGNHGYCGLLSNLLMIRIWIYNAYDVLKHLISGSLSFF